MHKNALSKKRILDLIVEEYRNYGEEGGQRTPDRFKLQWADYQPRNPHPKHVRLVNFVLDTIPVDGCILDVCIGAGVPSRVFDRLGYKVLAIESSEIAGEWKQKFASTNIKCIDLRIEDEKIPLDDGVVDFTYFGATLEHIHNSPRPIIHEFYRVLKPGGFLFIDVPNIVCLRHRVLLLAGKSIMPSIDYVYNCDFHAEHHREYTLQDAIKIIEWSGFTVHESYHDDIAFQRSLVKKGKLAYERGAGDEYYKSASIWDYNLPFNPLNWFDWIKLFAGPLVKIFPPLADDIVVIGRKPTEN